MTNLPKAIRENWPTTLFYSAVAALILWPLLGPGFILTLDMVFTPNLAMPDTITSSYLFHAGLHVLSLVVPSEIIEKLLLFAVLVLSGLGMHRLMRTLQLPDTPKTVVAWAAYASGLLYMINPFTYSRFMAGQYSVLLGYAAVPFFVVTLLRFLQGPSLKKALYLAVVTVVVSIVSIHTLGLIFVVTLIALSQTIWRHRTNAPRLKRLVKYGALAGLAFIIASSYWLVPLVQGSGSTAASIATFRGSDQSEFATGGDGLGSKLIHVLRLQGFWGERHDLFLLPQDELSWWGLVVTMVWVLVIIGAVMVWRQKREVGILLTASAVVAALLAAGVGTAWLADYIPFFAGYREPQKFAALIALSYAAFTGFAITWLFIRIKATAGRLVIAVAFALVLVGLTPVMFGGFDGQLIPRHYPPDWYAVNQQLNNDTGSYQTLFLPWHLYMSYQFAGRLIANPGGGFFDRPLLVSDDPELGSIKPAVANAQKQLLTTRILPQAADSNTLGQQLVPLHVKYVLLAKDDDYQAYSYLDHQTDLHLITETATLKLYRNTAFREGNE